MNAIAEKLYAHENLTFAETHAFFKEIFEGKVDPVVLGSVLTVLKMNGYTADEIERIKRDLGIQEKDIIESLIKEV